MLQSIFILFQTHSIVKSITERKMNEWINKHKHLHFSAIRYNQLYLSNRSVLAIVLSKMQTLNIHLKIASFEIEWISILSKAYCRVAKVFERERENLSTMEFFHVCVKCFYCFKFSSLFHSKYYINKYPVT